MSILDTLFGNTQNEKKRNLVRAIYVTVASILLITVVLALALVFPADKPDDTTPNDSHQSETVHYAFSDTKSGSLLVVNKKSSAYDFTLNPESNLKKMSDSLPSADGSSLYTLQKEGMLANAEALSALNEMIKDFYDAADNKEAAKKLSIRTAYRSYEAQNALSSVPAGHSDFHTGMLFELTVGDTVTSISTDSTFNWIYENAHNYGFIERYPESKFSITGVSDFDNAFRFVGTPHSTYIKEKGISLEEYVDLIKNSDKPISVSGYKVFYVKAETDKETDITFSSRYYSVSGDNNGGFIVTIK